MIRKLRPHLKQVFPVRSSFKKCLDLMNVKSNRIEMMKQLQTCKKLIPEVLDIIFSYLPFVHPWEKVQCSYNKYSSDGAFVMKTDHELWRDTSTALLSKTFQSYTGSHFFAVKIHKTGDEMWIGVTNNPSENWQEDWTPGERDTEHAWLYYSGRSNYRKKLAAPLVDKNDKYDMSDIQKYG